MKQDEKDFYTKLTYEHKCVEDFGPQTISQKITVWDNSMNDMMDMFHTLMIGAGFPESCFVGGLIEWLEEYHPEYEIYEKDENESEVEKSDENA